MKESDLVEGFEQNKQEEKEEISRYGIKKKEKEKNRIHSVINVVLAFIFICAFIYSLNLNDELYQKEDEMKLIIQNNKDLMNSLNQNKEKFDKIGAQTITSLLNKCSEETSTLNDEINELKEQFQENEENIKIKLDEYIKKNSDISEKIKSMEEYYNISQ